MLKKDKDISMMNREELLDIFTVIQQRLVDIGERIKEISDTKKLLEQEEKEADKAFTALSPKMKTVFWLLLLVLNIMALIEGWGLMGCVVISILAGIFLKLVLGLPNELLFKKEKMAKKIEYQNQHVLPLKNKLQECTQALEAILNDEDTVWAMDVLQEKYFDINAINYFLNYLAYRRADCYKEAVNLYEEEIHRLKMEELQQSILDNAEKTALITEQNAQTLKNVEASASSAAKAAKISAIVNYATYANIRKIRKQY